MAEHLYRLVLATLKGVVQFATIVSINIDEVTTIDNTFWMDVHIYAMES